MTAIAAHLRKQFPNRRAASECHYRKQEVTIQCRKPGALGSITYSPRTVGGGAGSRTAALPLDVTVLRTLAACSVTRYDAS